MTVLPLRLFRLPRPLWRWLKVFICLALIDVIMGRLGLIWQLPPVDFPSESSVLAGQAYDISRTIHYLSRQDKKGFRAFVLGSSLVGVGVSDLLVASTAHRLLPEVPVAVYKLYEFGAFASDIFAITYKALPARPDLIIYGTTPRDYPLPTFIDPRSSAVAQMLGSDVPLDMLEPATADELVSRLLTRYWLLYRYRALFHGYAHHYFRIVRDKLIQQLVATALAHPGFAPQSGKQQWHPGMSLADFLDQLERTLPQGYFISLSHTNLRNYNPDTNPQLELIPRWARLCSTYGIRPVILMMPENPLLKSAPNPYFNAELSQKVTERLRAAARENGISFYDLRTLLGPEHFKDLNHANDAGAEVISQRVGEILVRELQLARQALRKRE